MALDEDFRELIETARDAVRELLDGSQHDSWGALRIGYGQLRDALERDDKVRDQEEHALKRQEQDDAWAAAQNAWKGIPTAARESLLLHVLEDDRLVLRELTSRLNAELGYEGKKPRAVHESDLRYLVSRMLRAGQLERAAETFNVNHTRYRYFRRHALDGPIADLERAYNDDAEGVS